MPALRVIIHESTSKIKSSKALSWVIISATIGINSEPMVGEILRQYRAWQASFYLLLIISTAPIFIVLKYLPETNHNKKKQSLSELNRAILFPTLK